MSVLFEKINKKWVMSGVLVVAGFAWWLNAGDDATVAKKEQNEQPVIIADEKGVVTAFDSHAMQGKSQNKIVPEGVYVPAQVAGIGKMDEAGRVIPPPLPPVRTVVQPGLDPEQLDRGVRAHRHPEAIHPEWEHSGDSVSRKE